MTGRYYYQIRALVPSLIDKTITHYGSVYGGTKGGKMIFDHENYISRGSFGKVYETREWAMKIARRIVKREDMKHFSPLGVAVMEYDRQLSINYERVVERIFIDNQK